MESTYLLSRSVFTLRKLEFVYQVLILLILQCCLLCMIIRYHSAVSVASLYDTLSNPVLTISHLQAEMAWTSLLVAAALISTIVYSDIQFTLESDPLINHNLLAYLSSREDLVSYLSSYSNNIADTLGGSLSSAGTYKTSYNKQRYKPTWFITLITSFSNIIIEEGENQEFC